MAALKGDDINVLCDVCRPAVIPPAAMHTLAGSHCNAALWSLLTKARMQGPGLKPSRAEVPQKQGRRKLTSQQGVTQGLLQVDVQLAPALLHKVKVLHSKPGSDMIPPMQPTFWR